VDAAADQLRSSQCNLRSAVTSHLQVVQQELCELELALFSKGQNGQCSYIDLITEMQALPVQFKARLAIINIGFLILIATLLVLAL
jgi:hypothetical protein